MLPEEIDLLTKTVVRRTICGRPELTQVIASNYRVKYAHLENVFVFYCFVFFNPAYVVHDCFIKKTERSVHFDTVHFWFLMAVVLTLTEKI